MVHFESDGNGGYIISKKFMSFISIMCLILPPLISTVSFIISTDNRISYIEYKQNLLDDKMENIKTNVMTLSENTAIISTKVIDIQDDVKEIKQELRQSQHT